MGRAGEILGTACVPVDEINDFSFSLVRRGLAEAAQIFGKWPFCVCGLHKCFKRWTAAGSCTDEAQQEKANRNFLPILPSDMSLQIVAFKRFL